MIQGLRTVVYPVDDLARAKAWYGAAIRVGAVRDPFGNVFGITEHPHFDPKQVR